MYCIFCFALDEDGPYYWHIKTGTIQREPPSPTVPEKHFSETSAENNDDDDDDDGDTAVSAETDDKKDSKQEHHLQEFESHAFKYATESIKSL